VDDLGLPVEVPRAVSRVVSLVPSLTESVAMTAPGLLVGATDWCSHPADLDVTRVRGTKNPDTDRVIALRPDVVLANAEENRAPDLDALRAAGLAVWVTYPRTVPAALDSLRRMLVLACGLEPPPWWVAAADAWSRVAATDAWSRAGATDAWSRAGATDAWSRAGATAGRPAGGVAGPAGGAPGQPADRGDPARWPRTAVVPIWRRPWMAVGSDTFAGDVLARLGVGNVLADSPERYPRFDPGALPPHDLVVLPDEPYAFTAGDGPETFAPTPCALVSGRHLTWYGPSLAEAPAVLGEALARAAPYPQGPT
jgi:hypothetical protein